MRIPIRLNNTGGRIVGFNIGTGFAGAVRGVEGLPDGDVYAGGDFATFNGAPVGRIVRLDSNGTPDALFNPGTGFNGSVNSLALAPDGSQDVYAAGNFTSFNGTAVGYIARLNPDGSLDSQFNMGTGLNSLVYQLNVRSDGDVMAFGAFSQYNGTAGTKGYVRINSDGSLDSTTPIAGGATGGVAAIAISAEHPGRVYVGGSYTSINDSTKKYLSRLDSDGTVDSTFDPGTGPNTQVGVVAVEPGKSHIYIAGNFTAYNSTTGLSHLARINSDGSLDTTFVTGTGLNSFVGSLAVANDGDLYVGGNFAAYNGDASAGLVRINSDGSRDTGFDVGSGFGGGSVRPTALATDGSGDIYVGGGFTTYKGVGQVRIARLNSDGSVDSGFNVGSGFDAFVATLALAKDGTGDLYVGGMFTTYKGAAVSLNLVRLNSDGSLDTGFNVGTGTNFGVNAICPALDGSGDVYVFGSFTTLNGVAVTSGLMRLHSNGSVDTTFAPSGGLGYVATGTVLLDGSEDVVYAGGSFISGLGVTLNNLARLNRQGQLD